MAASYLKQTRDKQEAAHVKFKKEKFVSAKAETFPPKHMYYISTNFVEKVQSSLQEVTVAHQDLVYSFLFDLEEIRAICNSYIM